MSLVVLFSCDTILDRNNANHDANAHMHRSSHDDLIARFDDPKRDVWQKPKIVLQSMQLDSSMSVMDIGAGSGYFSLRMAPLVKQVIAADVDSSFLRHIGRIVVEKEIKNVDTLLIPFDGPIDEGYEMDRILIVNTYHHIKNRVQYFDRLKSKLDSNGFLFIVDFRKDLNGKHVPGPPEHHKISCKQVLKELQQAGYSNTELDTNSLDFQYIIKAGIL
jgi:cyclopropane fatty-acyl-phospholipid synthase-like methyltransferase